MRCKRSLASVFLELAAVLLVTALAFAWGKQVAWAERGYAAYGGEYLLLFLPLIYYVGKATLSDCGDTFWEPRKENEFMKESIGPFTIDEIITGLGQLQISTDEQRRGICKAAVSILFALSEEGVQRPEDVLDILHDYRAQAKQYAALQRKHAVAGKPYLKDAVWHCPDCGRRVAPNHSFCHRCGKKLGWR